ncbi:heme-binding protein [Brevundimonas sp.]|uniref:GlcG/HbpS family heme-binding protein n=1 Tax=Brevundimonas sp. TaxID=1871086 RepID=UPI0017B536B0|nr:heme-binding protein [Brevundimonas sp.]MBA4806458.1 heme-binding protein [Brevundimonas sp.]
MKLLIAIACLTVLSTPAYAQSTPPTPAVYGDPISAEQAQAIIQRGLDEGARRGLPLAIAVVEPSGELVAFVRMDGVPYGSIPLAQNKARTSARFRTSTVSREEQVNNGRYALLTADDFVAIGGGVPIVLDGRVVGAVGISGGTSAEDAVVAAAIAGPQ